MRDSFNFRWYILAALPTNEKQDVSVVWQWLWSVSFAIFRTVSKVKEKGCLVRSSANLKSLLNGRFTLLIYFKMNYMNFRTVVFSLTLIHKFCFQVRDTFFYCLSLSGFFFQSNPHSEDPFLIIRSILKWYGSYLRQPSLSNNNRLAPKTTVKVFCTAYWLIPLSQ